MQQKCNRTIRYFLILLFPFSLLMADDEYHSDPQKRMEQIEQALKELQSELIALQEDEEFKEFFGNEADDQEMTPNGIDLGGLEGIEDGINLGQVSAFEPKFDTVFTGYINLDYAAPNLSGTSFNGNEGFSFLWVPIWLARYGDNILMTAKVAVFNFNGTTLLSLPYAYVAYIYNDFLTLQFGKHLIPFGVYWNWYFPRWIVKLPSDPVIRQLTPAFAIVPNCDFGVIAKGALSTCCLFPSLHSSFISYEFWIGNGPTESETGINYVESSGNSPNNNNQPAGGVRLAFWPTICDVVGFSYMKARWNSNKKALESFVPANFLGRSLYFHAACVDWNFNMCDWGIIRGEYIWSEYNDGTHYIQQQGYWAQYSTFFSFMRCFPLLHKLYCCGQCFWDNSEIVFRSGGLWSDLPGEERRRFSVGYGYYFTPSMTLKLAFDHNYGDERWRSNVFLARFAYGW